jgi:hypothetical protein
VVTVVSMSPLPATLKRIVVTAAPAQNCQPKLLVHAHLHTRSLQQCAGPAQNTGKWCGWGLPPGYGNTHTFKNDTKTHHMTSYLLQQAHSS